MGGRLHLKYLKTLLWSQKSKFKIWIRSDQWFLSYNPFPRRLEVGVGGRLVKSDLITKPSAILKDGSFLWAECGNIKMIDN